MKSKKWYKLDNIGKFYSLIQTNKFPNIFRLSATLTEDINDDILKEALDETLLIFPNFNVNLKKGFFWYYLDETNKKPEILEENLPICFKLYNNSDDFLYRVTYFNKRINLEISHILSDGLGSMQFFKTLICNYLKIYYDLKEELVIDSTATEKIENSFDKYYQKIKKVKEKKVKNYVYKGKKFKHKTRFLECHLNCKDTLALAHSYNTTLTAFLVSVLIWSFKNELSIKDQNKAIKIDIPVDLRSYFKSTSSKNFFGLTSVHYKYVSNKDSLEDIIKKIDKQFKENLNSEKLKERANKMVAFEKNILCRITPIFLKNVVLHLVDKYTSKLSTTSLSNIGIIKFDRNYEDLIKEVNCLTSTSNFQFTLCSYKNDLSIGISSKYRYNDIIKNFCRFFSDKNIKVKINTSEVD